MTKIMYLRKVNGKWTKIKIRQSTVPESVVQIVVPGVALRVGDGYGAPEWSKTTPIRDRAYRGSLREEDLRFKMVDQKDEILNLMSKALSLTGSGVQKMQRLY